MSLRKPLPILDDFSSDGEYVDSLLSFATTSSLFQTLCGGVHILDFFTQDPSLYSTVIPEEWKSWLEECESMELLDLLMRDHLDASSVETKQRRPPQSLLKYTQDIRKHSLQRSCAPGRVLKQKTLPRHVAVGMIPKKIHEVVNFAHYVNDLAVDIATQSDAEITHFVDFGSGQNYLGRALASPPYNRNIIAVESKENNINGAKSMDVLARLAERETVTRNKKLYRQVQDSMTPAERLNDKAVRRAAKPQPAPAENVADLRPIRDLATIYKPGEGKGFIQYIEHNVDNGDLSDVVRQIKQNQNSHILSSLTAMEISKDVESRESDEKRAHSLNTSSTGHQVGDPRLMAISIHSCGNLSHHGIRSLLINPSVHAIAIVGCCYNLLTERLGPPTYKIPSLRPNLQPINAHGARESPPCDAHGFPMSERIANYKEDGIRLNITARMMAVQAPQNWTEKESDAFFTRHFFRALLQKVFLDRGVVSKPHATSDNESSNLTKEVTDAVILGSLRKSCYGSFTAYVRGAIEKLSANPVRGNVVAEKMGNMTDEEIDWYAQTYGPRKKELSVMWSLMAFSAGVVESLIVVDRYLFLKEHSDVVKDCWVEAVFDYKQSPRNLVVVGIKK